MDTLRQRLEALLDQDVVIGYGNNRKTRHLLEELAYMEQYVAVRREFEPYEWWSGDLDAIKKEYQK